MPYFQRVEGVVLFDLVGTLIRARVPIGQQYAEMALRYGVRADGERLGAAFRRVMGGAAPMAPGRRTLGETAELEREWWRVVVRDVLAEAGVSGELSGPAFEEFFASLYAHFTTADAWELFPDVLPALGRLRDSGAQLGLITNYDTRVFAVLDALELAPWLSAVVIPAHVGSAKPSPAIFLAALERMNSRPGDALFVGDELEDDYFGAQAVGIRPVLVDRGGTHRGVPGITRVESLAELSESA